MGMRKTWQKKERCFVDQKSGDRLRVVVQHGENDSLITTNNNFLLNTPVPSLLPFTSIEIFIMKKPDETFGDLVARYGLKEEYAAELDKLARLSTDHINHIDAVHLAFYRSEAEENYLILQR